MKIPIFPIPSERELDAQVARLVFGQEIRMLPAHRECECGSIVIWPIEYAQEKLEDVEQKDPDFMDNMFVRDSQQVWASKEGREYGQYPSVLIKAKDPEHCDYWDPMPLYSTSIEDAWKVVEEIRGRSYSVGRRFVQAMGDFAWFMMDCDVQAEVICKAALVAIGESS